MVGCFVSLKCCVVGLFFVGEGFVLFVMSESLVQSRSMFLLAFLSDD